MKFCTVCGAKLSDDAKFCHNCGGTQQSTNEVYTTGSYNDAEAQEDKECLDNFYTFLKWERFGWKLSAILFLIATIIFAMIGLIALAGGAVAFSESDFNSMPATFSFGIGFLYLFLSLILYLPVTIINFSMSKRTKNYMNLVYTDMEAVEERCSNIGIIILGAFFNTLALIFIIINFVRTKTNKRIIERIKNKQKTGV